MPIEISLPSTSDSLSLEEYIECINASRYDFSSHADLVDSAQYLKKLGNNKEFLLDRVFDELHVVAEFQRKNYYGPQVFMLHATDKYFVRANVWRPLSKVEESIKGFQYDVCHDHNFDILTIGYFGPGYRARTYTYEPEQVIGILGEKVTLLPDGIFTLFEGRMALYRAKKDVHIQLPPEELSISLNFIPKNDRINQLQFQFDETSGKICRYLQSSGSETVVRLAGLLGDDSCLELLETISMNHPSPQIRALAMVSLLQISPGLYGSINGKVTDAHSALVRDIVEREMGQYGACLRMHDHQGQ